jgi:hypothetical protein
MQGLCLDRAVREGLITQIAVLVYVVFHTVYEPRLCYLDGNAAFLFRVLVTTDIF